MRGFVGAVQWRHALEFAMEKLQSHNGNIVKEQWKHGEILKLEGSTPKGAGPLFFCFDSEYADKGGDVMTVVKVGLGVALVVLIVGIALAVSKDVEELIEYTRDPIYAPPGV